MPELNGMHCHVEIGHYPEVLPEQCTTYGDRTVGCYIAVPGPDVAFSIHFAAHGNLAPGLAAFVFIDGQYQANRNVTGLWNAQDMARTPSPLVHMHLRQKEEVGVCGNAIAGREWRFSRLRTVSKPPKPSPVNQSYLDNLGTIELVVLRCIGPPNLPRTIATDLATRSSAFRGPMDRGIAQQHHVPVPTVRPHTSAAWQRQYTTVWRQTQHSPAKLDKSEKRAILSMLQPVRKPYWSSWSQQDTSNKGQRGLLAAGYGPRSPYQLPEDEPLPIPRDYATAKRLDLQVTTGPSARYAHLRLQPVYMDSMVTPYAVFTFVYRGQQSPDDDASDTQSAGDRSQTSSASSIGSEDEEEDSDGKEISYQDYVAQRTRKERSKRKSRKQGDWEETNKKKEEEKTEQAWEKEDSKKAEPKKAESKKAESERGGSKKEESNANAGWGDTAEEGGKGNW